MVCDDGEFDSVTWIQAVAASLNFRHVEEQLFAFLDFVIQKAELSLDGVHNRTFLLANSSHLKVICLLYFKLQRE